MHNYKILVLSLWHCKITRTGTISDTQTLNTSLPCTGTQTLEILSTALDQE